MTKIKTTLAQDNPKEGVIALNFETNSDGVLPEWVPLIPPGEFSGRDGRKWVNDKPENIVSHFIDNKRDIALDVEHSSEIKAKKGEASPAGGWIKTLEVRDGWVFGKLEWNEYGSSLVNTKKYRYYSPAFLFDQQSKRVISISSVGLTNKHNLYLPALNHQQAVPSHEKTTSYNAVKLALGLNQEASEEDLLTGIITLQNQLSQALNSQQQFAAYKTQIQKDEIANVVNSAITSGKIPPAFREYHLAACRQEGGIELFNNYVDTLDAFFPDTGLDNKQFTQPALNEQQQHIAHLLGQSEEEYSQNLATHGQQAG